MIDTIAAKISQKRKQKNKNQPPNTSESSPCPILSRASHFAGGGEKIREEWVMFV